MSATKTTEQVETTPAISIPAARIPDAATPDVPAKKPNLKDRMKGLKAAPVAKKPAADKRPEYEAPKEAVDALSRFIPADLIRKLAEKRAENANKEVSEVMLKAFCRSLWQNRVVPSNPKIIVKDGVGQPDMSAIFQVQDRFTPNNMAIPAVKPEMEEEEVIENITNTLIEAGLEEADAKKLVNDEIETSKRRLVRPINELISGHYGPDKQWIDPTPAEEAVAGKFMDFLETLTAEEQALLRRDEMKVTVKPQFLTRVCTYAHAAEQVQAILRIFSPVNFVSHSAIGLSDDEATKITKLQQAADELIGSTSLK